tara:strand:+ start:355 stop:1107 length:753 start_codon:yes stop_codon:yes gene_type:complete
MIIAIGNRKGGTGKTTTVVNIGRALAMKGKRVLLIDLDPQANLSYSFGISTEGCLLGEALLENDIDSGSIYYKNGIDIIPSTNELQEYETEFIREQYNINILKKTLDSVKEHYDFILIDCPPAASFLTKSALVACDTVLIPMLMDALSLQGFEQMVELVSDIKDRFNSKLWVIGVLGVIVDERRHLTRDILSVVKNNYGIDVFENYIRQNVKAAEAPAHGKSVLDYAPKSNSAKDYISVVDELLTNVSEN